MEASFKSRLDRTFGILSDAAKEGDSHLWSVEESVPSGKNRGLLRDGNSDEDEEEEEVSGYANFLKSENKGGRGNSRFFGEEDLEDLESGEDDDDDDGDGEDEDEEEQMRCGKKKRGGEVENQIRARDGKVGEDDEEREVREMVGMDCTLDFEDEEDEYDKVAVGADGLEDRLFLSQVRSFGACRQQLNSLPTSFVEMRQTSRDRRANHKAALARLEEDDREAATRAGKEPSQEFKWEEMREELTVRQDNGSQEFNTEEMGEDLAVRQDNGSQEFKAGEIIECPAVRQDNGSQEFKTEEMGEDSVVRQENGGEAMDVDGDGRKEEPVQEVRKQTLTLVSSIIKEGKPRKAGKRVKFSVDETPMADTRTRIRASDIVSQSVTSVSTRSVTQSRYSKVPDYVKNPSKYTHYTLDWLEQDEEQANMDALRAARGNINTLSSTTQDTCVIDRPDSEEDRADMDSFWAARLVSSTTQDMVSEEPSQGPSESARISFNPLVKKTPKQARGGVVKGVGPEGDLPMGIVNVAANFDMDSNLGGLISMEDDDTSSGSTGKSGRVVRRYRNRVTEDIETD